MRKPPAAIALVAVLGVACGGGAARQGATAAQVAPAEQPESAACEAPPVRLRFAWPERVTARVRGLYVTESLNQDGSDPRRFESPSELQMEITAEGPERHVRFVVAGATRTRSQGFAPDVEGVRPTWVLAADGAVKRVAGVDRMAARLGEGVAAGELEPAAADILGPNLTPEAQLETARAHWTWIVHAWNGRELRCGEPVRERMRVSALALNSATPLSAEVTLVYEDAVECPGGRGGGCVLLRATMDVDSEELASSVYRSLGREGTRLLGARVVRTVRLITEPDTLLPHAVGFAEEMRLDWDDHGDRYSRAVFDEQSYEMRYDVEPPSRERTSIFYDPNGGAFAVVGPDGQPIQLPDTEDCQRLTRCCEAAGRLGGSFSLTCGMVTATSRDGDCQSGLAAVRELVAGGGHQIPECAP